MGAHSLLRAGDNPALSAVQGGPARREQTALFWFSGPFLHPSLPFSGSRKEGGACHWSETEGRLGTTESTPWALRMRKI